MSNMNDENKENSTTLFGKEFEKYKQSIGAKKDVTAIASFQDEFQISESELSRLKKGKRPLSDERIEFFSKLFGIRPEYLKGEDTYRTDLDLKLANKDNETICSSFRTILQLLGYADLEMDETDYNISFPPNTIAFLEELKNHSDLLKNMEVLCDVSNDKFIFLDTDEYNLLIQRTIDFIRSELETLFEEKNAPDVPSMVTDEGRLLKAHNQFELNDGSTADFDMDYIPTHLDKRTKKSKPGTTN